MSSSPEQKFVESIPGVVPEHPLQYPLDLLRHDRKECSKHMGYSPAATSWMMSSAGEFHDLTSRIRYFRQKCVDIQMGADQMRDYEKKDIEMWRGSVARKREHHMTHILMERDFARERLDEAVQYNWKYEIPYRAAILLELDGYLPTFEQIKQKHFKDNESSELSADGRELVNSDYHSIVTQMIASRLGPEYLGDGVNMEKLYTFVYNERIVGYKAFREMLSGKAIDIFKKGESTGSIDEEEAKILAFLISRGETGDLYALDEHTLSRFVLTGPRILTREMIKAWYPKEQAIAA